MKCQQADNLIQRSLDHDLDESEERTLQTHLAHCPACAQFYASMRALSLGLENLPQVEPPYSIVDSIMPKLAGLAPDGQKRPAANANADTGVLVTLDDYLRSNKRDVSETAPASNVPPSFAYPAADEAIPEDHTVIGRAGTDKPGTEAHYPQGFRIPRTAQNKVKRHKKNRRMIMSTVSAAAAILLVVFVFNTFDFNKLGTGQQTLEQPLQGEKLAQQNGELPTRSSKLANRSGDELLDPKEDVLSEMGQGTGAAGLGTNISPTSPVAPLGAALVPNTGDAISSDGTETAGDPLDDGSTTRALPAKDDPGVSINTSPDDNSKAQISVTNGNGEEPFMVEAEKYFNPKEEYYAIWQAGALSIYPADKTEPVWTFNPDEVVLAPADNGLFSQQPDPNSDVEMLPTDEVTMVGVLNFTWINDTEASFGVRYSNGVVKNYTASLELTAPSGETSAETEEGGTIRDLISPDLGEEGIENGADTGTGVNQTMDKISDTPRTVRSA
jgi:hypothetical protein